MTVKKALLRFDEVMIILGCSRDHVYDLLAADKIKAYNPQGRPGTRGTKILASSIEEHLQTCTITSDQWVK